MTIAVVTGANTGIGFEIVKLLSQKLPDATIVLCSRNKDRGLEALNDLKKENINAELGILDIEKEDSIKEFASFMKEKFNKIDILINNAGFAFKSAATEPPSVQARKTIDINFYGTLNVTNALRDLIPPKGRIINMSSSAGKLSIFHNKDLVDELTKDDLTVPELSDFMERFISETKKETHVENGWPKSTYGCSKAGLSALTRVWAREWPELQVNACCPGWCRTNMAGDKAPKSAADGAKTPVFLAVCDSDASGKFFYEEKEADW